MIMKVKGKIGTNIFEMNRHYISAKELERATRTLIGKPVTLDFGKKAIGTVVNATFDKDKKQINYEAELDDKYSKNLKAYGTAKTIDVNRNELKAIVFDGLSSVEE